MIMFVRDAGVINRRSRYMVTISAPTANVLLTNAAKVNGPRPNDH